MLAGIAAGSTCSCSCCSVRAAESWEAAAHAECGVLLDAPADCEHTCAPASGSDDVDMTRFCFDSCRPTSHNVHSACVLAAQDEPVVREEVRAVAAPSVDAGAARGGMSDEADKETIEVAMLRENKRLGAVRKRKAEAAAKVARAPSERDALAKQAPPATARQLDAAKSAMLSAKTRAKAAGNAARRAKESYELVMRSSREMSEYAGKMVLDEIKREAAETSTKALKIRNDYVKAAQDNAVNSAVAAAAPYKQAAKVAVSTAATWNLRANEFAASAGALKSQAAQLADSAHTYTETQDFEDAQTFMRQAHQVTEESQAMADRADAAHKQANDLQGTLNWYTVAGRGMAAATLANSMPYDVAPPPLPPPVFLQTRDARQTE